MYTHCIFKKKDLISAIFFILAIYVFKTILKITGFVIFFLKKSTISVWKSDPYLVFLDLWYGQKFRAPCTLIV